MNPFKTLVLVGGVWLGAPFAVTAQANVEATPVVDAPEPTSDRVREESAQEGMFLPIVVAPASDRASAAVVAGWGGYDAARDSAVFKTVGDIKVIGPVDVRIGLTYAPQAVEGESAIQPHGGLRFRILSQERQGIDFAAALFYRMERFTDDEGLVQGLFAFGRTFGRLSLLANAAYGQDPEGDDREGEFALAALYGLSAALQLGLESHVRFDLFSDDEKREARRDSEFDMTSGPLVSYGLGPVALLAQVGVAAVQIERVEVGPVALAGLAAAF